jgi:hypothetical protein
MKMDFQELSNSYSEKGVGATKLNQFLFVFRPLSAVGLLFG